VTFPRNSFRSGLSQRRHANCYGTTPRQGGVCDVCSPICCASRGRGDGLGRALRRRITLLFAGCSGCPVPSRMTVLRRERSQSCNASPGSVPPVAELARESPDRACVHPSPPLLEAASHGCKSCGRTSASFGRSLQRAPKEPDQFARNRDDHLGRRLASLDQVSIAPTEPLLCSIGQRNDSRGLSCASLTQR